VIQIAQVSAQYAEPENVIPLVMPHSFWTRLLTIVQRVLFTAKTAVLWARVIHQIVILAMYTIHPLARVLNVRLVAHRVLHQEHVHHQPAVPATLYTLLVLEHASRVIHTVVQLGVIRLATATKRHHQTVNLVMDSQQPEIDVDLVVLPVELLRHQLTAIRVELVIVTMFANQAINLIQLQKRV
jgi:hypothetical protein